MAALTINVLKQHINRDITTNRNHEITGAALNQDLIDLIDTLLVSNKGVLNVNEWNETTDPYESKQDARDDVPEDLRYEGLIITYKLEDGWLIEQNKAISNTWNEDDNWKCLIDSVEIRDSSYYDNSQGDLEIVDENGFVLIRLSNGHIATKNFDSAQLSEPSNSIPLSGFSLSNNKVSQTGLFLVPILGMSGKIKAPDGIKVKIYYGTVDITSTTDWLFNNDTYSLPESAMVMKVEFASDTETLSVAGIEELLSSGAIKVYYDTDDVPMMARNSESEKRTKAAMLDLATAPTAALLQELDYHCHPTIVHLSDLHGDMKRLENAMEYARAITADAVCVTGDNVIYQYPDGAEFVKAVADKYPDIPIFTCIGNHECLNLSSSSNRNSLLFQKFISPFVEQGGYLQAANTPATNNYYYADIAERKLRIIAINQFDNGVNGGQGVGGRIGSTQLSWLASTLASTPNDYSIVVIMHSPEDGITVPQDAAAFNQTTTYNGSDYAGSGMYCSSARPIQQIINAFINRQSTTISYTENSLQYNNSESVSVPVDFTSVNSSIKFCGYLCGHRHRDRLGYSTNASSQLVLDVVTSNAHYSRGGDRYFANEVDLPRGAKGVVQDSFNVYVLDTIHEKVKVVRVGSDVNMDFVERKCITMEY